MTPDTVALPVGPAAPPPPPACAAALLPLPALALPEFFPPHPQIPAARTTAPSTIRLIVAFGDMARDGKCGKNQRVGSGLGFAARRMPHHAKDFATQCDRFLPDFEITNARSHGGKNGGHAERLWYL